MFKLFYVANLHKIFLFLSPIINKIPFPDLTATFLLSAQIIAPLSTLVLQFSSLRKSLRRYSQLSSFNFCLSSLHSRPSSHCHCVPVSSCHCFLSSYNFPLCANHCAATLNSRLSTFVSRLSTLVPHPPVIVSPCPYVLSSFHPLILSSHTLPATFLHLSSFNFCLSSLHSRPSSPCHCVPVSFHLSILPSSRHPTFLIALSSLNFRLSTFNSRLSSLVPHPATPVIVSSCPYVLPA